MRLFLSGFSSLQYTLAVFHLMVRFALYYHFIFIIYLHNFILSFVFWAAELGLVAPIESFIEFNLEEMCRLGLQVWVMSLLLFLNLIGFWRFIIHVLGYAWVSSTHWMHQSEVCSFIFLWIYDGLWVIYFWWLHLGVLNSIWWFVLKLHTMCLIFCSKAL